MGKAPSTGLQGALALLADGVWAALGTLLLPCRPTDAMAEFWLRCQARQFWLGIVAAQCWRSCRSEPSFVLELRRPARLVAQRALVACGFLLIGYVAVAGMGYLLPAACCGWALRAHEAAGALLLACILSSYTATVLRSPGGVLCGSRATFHSSAMTTVPCGPQPGE